MAKRIAGQKTESVYLDAARQIESMVRSGTVEVLVQWLTPEQRQELAKTYMANTTFGDG